jgi:hypothetical protein
MSATIDWSEVAKLLDTLYRSTDRLEALFPGRKFTLDGHLVGSIGEVIAAYMFDLNLLPGSSKGHDATARDGRNVEVKFTQGASVAIRHEPDHLIVLHRGKGRNVSVVFNGPGKSAWEQAGKKQSNGQRPISLAKLREIDASIGADDRLTQVQEAPV